MISSLLLFLAACALVAFLLDPEKYLKPVKDFFKKRKKLKKKKLKKEKKELDKFSDPFYDPLKEIKQKHDKKRIQTISDDSDGNGSSNDGDILQT